MIELLSALPPLIVDLGAWLTFAGIIFGATWLTPVRRAVKWLFRNNIGDPVIGAFRTILKEENKPTEDAVAALRSEFETHATYVGHHLGPNGDTPPLWTRVLALEETFTSPDRRGT